MTRNIVRFTTGGSGCWLAFKFTAEEMAQFLADMVDPTVLQRAQDIIIGRDLDELQVRPANPGEEDERAQKRARDFSGWTPGEW